jgi:cell division septum initiation protein DivIVA
LHRSDEDLEKALEQLPTKLATFDKTKNDPVGAKALAARQEAGKLVRAAETKIRALTVELAESTKRLVAQQEMMAELEELWELAKARLALRQLTPFPSC